MNIPFKLSCFVISPELSQLNFWLFECLFGIGIDFDILKRFCHVCHIYAIPILVVVRQRTSTYRTLQIQSLMSPTSLDFSALEASSRYLDTTPSLYESHVSRWKNLQPPPGFSKASSSVVSFEKEFRLLNAQPSL